MTFDPTKPVQTRSGRPARILCTDFKDPEYPIIAAVMCEDGSEDHQSFTADGRMYSARHMDEQDLINTTERKSFWINAFAGGVLGSAWDTREEADFRKEERESLIEIRMQGDNLIGAYQHWDEK